MHTMRVDAEDGKLLIAVEGHGLVDETYGCARNLQDKL